MWQNDIVFKKTLKELARLQNKISSKFLYHQRLSKDGIKRVI
jgi:hypothetical protein